MTQTEVTLTRPRSADAFREVSYSNIEEYKRMAQMVADMLYLVKAANQTLPERMIDVDLAAETDRLFELYEGWAEEKGVKLLRVGNAKVQADRLMLQLAIGNSIFNVIKNTAEGGEVLVDL